MIVMDVSRTILYIILSVLHLTSKVPFSYLTCEINHEDANHQPMNYYFKENNCDINIWKCITSECHQISNQIQTFIIDIFFDHLESHIFYFVKLYMMIICGFDQISRIHV